MTETAATDADGSPRQGLGANGGRLRKILRYGAARGTSDGLLAVRGLVLASLLGPAAFGIWALVRLAMRYAVFAGLGVHRGLEYEVARTVSSIDEGESPSVERQWSTALAFVTTVFGGIGLVTVAASLLISDISAAHAMRWFAVAIVLEQMWIVGGVYLRAQGKLRVFGTLELASASMHAVLAVLLASIWGLSGAFASLVLATALSLGLLARHVPFRPKVTAGVLTPMIAIGFPIIASMFLATGLATADRLVVAAYGGTRLLGLYAFGVALAGLANTFPWIIRTVVFPEVYGGGPDGEEGSAIERHLGEIVLPFAWAFPPLLGVAAMVLGPLVAAVLPQYVDAVPAARIFIFTGVATGLSILGSLGVVAAGRQRTLPALAGAMLILNVALSFIALRVGFGLIGVAGAALLCTTVYGLAILAVAAHAAGVENPLRYLAMVTLPLAWSVAAVALVAGNRPLASLSSAVVAAVIYALLVTALVPRAVSEIGKLRRRHAHRS